jgi:hypothetical protein
MERRLPSPSYDPTCEPKDEADAFAAGYSKNSRRCDKNARADHSVQYKCAVSCHQQLQLMQSPCRPSSYLVEK